MRYLREVEMWKILVLNTPIGLIMSGPFTLSLMLIGGFKQSIIESELIGTCIILAVISSIAAANYILWKLSKKGNSRRININRLAIKGTSILMVLGITVGSYFTMYPVWEAINGWWH